MTANDGSADSALQAWAVTRMAGGTSADEAVGEVGRAPGRAQYDPADVISVFMTARQSAKRRNDAARSARGAARRS
jgi:hypothetical protein